MSKIKNDSPTIKQRTTGVTTTNSSSSIDVVTTSAPRYEDNFFNDETTHEITSEINSTSSSSTIFQYLATISKKLDSLGVETRGIERIQPYERSTNRTKQFISVMGLWLSACGGLSSMSSFYLGPLLFELGLRNTLLAGLLGEILGCFIAAYCSLMGPRSGCRQMVSGRFLFGWWFVKLVALVAIIGVMGWSVVNSVVGGQILSSVSDDKIPLWAGIVIIAAISLIVAIAGIKQLIRVEAFLSIPVNCAFLLLYIVASQKFDYLTWKDAVVATEGSEYSAAATVKGNWLSFFSLCYSITSTWGTIASDYYILFPENTPDWEIFAITFFGISIPTTFVGVAGILIGNVALTYQPWGDAYKKLGMGGLLNEAFKPWGAGGKFLLMIIFLSLISNNIINTYSAAFGVQLAGTMFAKVPRWLWAILLTAIYLICALVGRNEFSTILGNFLPMIGYWVSMYFIMLLEENTIFRTDKFKYLFTKEFPRVNKEEEQEEEEDGLDSAIVHHPIDARIIGTPLRQNQHYNFSIWNDYDKLTQGLAATASFIIGATGAAVGMSQAYWIGPLARRIGGEFGGDIAMWLCMGFSGLVYPPLRYLELKKFGR